MSDSINIITGIIADKLDLTRSVVRAWVKSNNYDLMQLNTIAKQIHNNVIYIPTLVDAIIGNKKYQISVY